jgi:hypothetical protein
VGHLRWPTLDIDLHLESIVSLEQFPLVARKRAHNKSAERTTRRPRTQ